MTAVLATPYKRDHLDAESGRQNSEGCWTGWIADMHMIKSVMRKCYPENYLSGYPKHRAKMLNTWLARFGIYTNGICFELDRRGSRLVKELIAKSNSEQGYWVRVDGARKDHKIKVSSVCEIAKDDGYVDPDFARNERRQLRGDFTRLGI